MQQNVKILHHRKAIELDKRQYEILWTKTKAYWTGGQKTDNGSIPNSDAASL